MTTFMLMRVNYDSRPLSPVERYSHPVTKAFSDSFVKRRKQEKKGGLGFHEGMNFATEDDDRARIYIPPDPPAGPKIDDDFVIFTLTYATEPGGLRNRLIGVHGGASIDSRDGIQRPDHDSKHEDIYYHASAPADLCTLFLTPSGQPLECEKGRHLPPGLDWRTGHRYFQDGDKELQYLRNILLDARKAAKQALSAGPKAATRDYLQREVSIVDKLLRLYFDRVATGSAAGQDILGLDGLGPTTRKALIEARLGQGRFRRGLEARWDYACAVTGCRVRELLRASHMKPWADSNRRERLSPSNGLLLSANIDALFDAHLISFSDDGAMLVSPVLTPQYRKSLGLVGASLTKDLTKEELKFLRHHQKVFRDKAKA